MKILELKQMENFKGGLKCSDGEGIVVGVAVAAVLIGVVTGGLGWIVLFGVATTAGNLGVSLNCEQ